MSNQNDDFKKNDLTRLEDISEFLHMEDPCVDDLFTSFENSSDVQKEIETEVVIEDVLILDSELTENSEQAENLFNDPEESFSQGDITFTSILDLDHQTLDESLDSSEENLETELPYQEPIQTTTLAIAPVELSFETPSPSQEKFEEVKVFAQNFSYGQIGKGGNPPFSLIIRNLKYADDAEDIIILLREFAIVNNENVLDFKKSLELGSLLIPQISEYCAIVLAHKFRRFEFDLEVGLSDEIHGKKSDDSNPRGLLKKTSIAQNKKESFKISTDQRDTNEILTSTTESLEGHTVKKYMGVSTSFAVVDEEELERLKFVQKSSRMESVLHQYETDYVVTSENAFHEYQKSFDLLFNDLCEQLKVKAINQKANALLGLNYQLSLLPFEKSALGNNCFQLSCSATFAIVEKGN